MDINVNAARGFMAGHARMLDRRRMAVLLGEEDTSGLIAALDGYRNADGGYGWGLEPDIRAAESQPGAALHAFEMLAEVDAAGAAGASGVAGADSGAAGASRVAGADRSATGADRGTAGAGRGAALCDWLGLVSLADGGLPFALPMSQTAATGPWWIGADASVSSLQITAAVTAAAQHAGRHDPDVAGHRWLARATAYCRAAIEAIGQRPGPYELLFAVRFLDATTESWTGDLFKRLGRYVPDDGVVRVDGGAENEALHALDFAPMPDRPARALFSQAVIDRDLDRLARGQQPDGGWTVDYLQISPAGALDWRGYATVRALQVLRANGCSW